jgi:hypothetical protein
VQLDPHCFALAEVDKAFAALEEHAAEGKIVVEP